LRDIAVQMVNVCSMKTVVCPQTVCKVFIQTRTVCFWFKE